MDASDDYSDYKTKDLYVALSCILESVNADGSWGGSDYEDWKCIITTLTTDLLLSCHVEPRDSWFIGNKKVDFIHSIRFLDNNIQETGAFGEDYWDACRLGIIINKYSLHAHFTNYNKLHSYIVRSIKEKTYQTKDEGWSGAGFYAITVDYVDSIKILDVELSNIANTVYDELVRLQGDDGAFRGATNKDGQEFVSPIWHTFQVLQTFLRRGISQSDSKITSIVNWLRNTQEEDGSFKDYRFTIMCTSYVVTTLSRLQNCQDIVQNGLKFLRSKIASFNLDSAARIMIALALRKVENPQLYFNATVLDLRNLETLEYRNKALEVECQQYNIKLQEQENRLKEYEKKYKDVGIVLTPTQAWLWPIILGLVFTVLVSFIFYLLGTKQNYLVDLPKVNIQNEVPTEHK